MNSGAGFGIIRKSPAVPDATQKPKESQKCPPPPPPDLSAAAANAPLVNVVNNFKVGDVVLLKGEKVGPHPTSYGCAPPAPMGPVLPMTIVAIGEATDKMTGKNHGIAMCRWRDGESNLHEDAFPEDALTLFADKE